MPRWIPPVLCTIYIVAGLFGRDPWRTDDAAGFGVAQTMASGSTIDWLLPNIEGVLVPRDGPLPFWIGALAMRAAVAINSVLDGALPGARITADLALRAKP